MSVGAESLLELSILLPWNFLPLLFFLMCFPVWQYNEMVTETATNTMYTTTAPVDGWLGQHHFHLQTQSSLHNLCPLLQVCLYVQSSQDPMVRKCQLKNKIRCRNYIIVRYFHMNVQESIRKPCSWMQFVKAVFFTISHARIHTITTSLK